MKIHRIKIEGFRSIKGPLEIYLPQICAIIGPNNVGKSNILSAINKVLGKDWITVNSFDEDDVYNKDFNQDINIEIEFDTPIKYQQYVGITAIDIPKIKFAYTRYKIGINKGQRRLEKNCLKIDDKPVYIYKNKPQTGRQTEYQPLSTIPQDIQEAIPVIYIGTDRSLKNQLPSSRGSLLSILMKEINQDFENPLNKIKIPDGVGGEIEIARLDYFKQGIKQAIDALRTEELNDLEKKIKDNALHQLGFDPVADSSKLDLFFGPFTSFDFYKSLEILINEGAFQINATELGAGFQNAIVLSIMKAFEEKKKQGAIFLIEEPEMFLHPQMQRSLYKTIRNIGQTNQVIYITHSPHFVTIPEFDEIVIIGKDANGTFKTKSSLPPDVRLKEKFRKELDPERNELFFAKKILFVEGDTEKLSLPEYAKRLSKDLDKNGSSIIEVGGKRNLKDFIELALSFKLPVGFMYDTDSSAFINKTDEAAYNQMLNDYSLRAVQVWPLDKDYEDELKKEFGVTDYGTYCSRYPSFTKPLKARMLAIDSTIPIPKFINPIIDWITT